MVPLLSRLTVSAVLIAATAGPLSGQVPTDTLIPRIGWGKLFTDTVVTLRMPRGYLIPGRPANPNTAVEAGERFAARVERQAARQVVTERSDLLLRRLYRGTEIGDLMGMVDPAAPERRVFGLDPSKVDIQFDGEMRLNISTERFENLRCTSYQLQDPNSGCRPRFSAPRIENNLRLNVRGLIGQRVHIDVDIDTDDAQFGNTIRAYYQGLEDEVVRRIDVGSITFRPMQSRFMTSAIPSENFGVSVELEFGPLLLQGLYATQKGKVAAERTYRIGGETVEPQDRLVRDLDYESGRFFWVVAPQSLPGYPDIDILDLSAMTLPASLRPTEVRVYRYRGGYGQGANPNLGGIPALARNTAGSLNQQVGPLQWTMLQPGRDYWVDPSGLWFALTSRLDPGDYLAVSYLTEDGGRVGTFPSTAVPGVSDSLRLIVEPNRGPEAGTFAHALRNVYRVAGSEMQRGSLDLSVMLNRSERPVNGLATWLAAFGLAVPSDQAVFDIENHSFPRPRDPGAMAVIRDNFVVFPTLQPFGDANRITDPAARNDSLYRTPEYLLFQEGPPAKFQLRMEYVATGAGDRGSLSLNAVNIREGSERLMVDGRRLVPGEDYSISYQTGTVTFLDPEGLFGSRVATVMAQFEERGFFAIAPTSIAGLSGRWTLSDRGGVNFSGLYQTETAAYNRPPLGYEPTASLIAGISTDWNFDVPSVTRLVDRITVGDTRARSSLVLNAELAVSRPDPNRSGDAFLEEFENDQGILVPLREQAWRYGSRPQSSAGAEAWGFGAGFDSTAAVQMIWQNLVPDGRGGARQYRPTDIDTSIAIIGGEAVVPETVMFLTLHADTAGGIVGFDNRSRWSQPRQDFTPRWRSMVTPLSLSGMDLSRHEYLEFWVLESRDRPIGTNGMRMVIDLGDVSEDALVMAPERYLVNGRDTVYTGRQYVGAGRLDTEASLTGIFNASTDDNGIQADRPVMIGPDGLPTEVPLCRRTISNVVEVYPWGDLGASCGAGNGMLDTEDLDGDLLLDARGEDEHVFRYVVDLTDPKYFVRTGVITPDPEDPTNYGGWTLYRVPLRDVDRRIGQPNIRLVRHLRMTMLTPPDNGNPDAAVRFAMARMRLVGAPWLARAASPISGISGSTGEPTGTVVVSSVSTENVELGYQSPPGLGNSINEIGSGSASFGRQVNEKSLRIVARGLRYGQRAEAYNRFIGGPQNLLGYRELRVWARGRGDGWDDRRLRAFIKVGTDDHNFYYYESEALTGTWQPEMVVNLDIWRELRAELEGRYLRGEAAGGADGCGGDPEAWVACQGGYIVHLRDPGIAPPNLAAVQEVAVGVRYVEDQGPMPEVELWVGDIRLSSPISVTGVASAASARLVAADFASFGLNWVSRDGQFRQLGESPSYRGEQVVSASSTMDMGKLLPQSIGVAIPLVFNHSSSRSSPELLTGSDILGAHLTGLRRPRASSSTMSISAKRTNPGGNLVLRTLLNPLTLSGRISTSGNTTEYTQSSSSSWDIGATWVPTIRRTTRPLGLGPLVGRMPSWLRDSEGAKGIAAGTYSPFPATFRLSSQLQRTAGDVTAFTAPINRLSDTILRPNTSLQHLWRNQASMSWNPVAMVNGSIGWQSTRDLREYPDSTPIGRLAGASRRSAAGIDVGVERDRTVSSSITLTPKLTAWFRPHLSTSSTFNLARNFVTRSPVRTSDDSLGSYILPQTLNNSRFVQVGMVVDPSVLTHRLFGSDSPVTSMTSRMRVIDLTWERTRSSTYDLAAFDPDMSYQLGLGGLSDFLRHQGSMAMGAAEVRVARASTTMDLLGLAGTISYSESGTDRYQRASAGQQFVTIETWSRDWPDMNLRLSRTFRSGAIRTLTIAGRVVERYSRDRFPTIASGEDAVSSSRRRTFAPSLNFTLSNGLFLEGRHENESGVSLDGGTNRESHRTRWEGRTVWMPRLPAALSGMRQRATVTLMVRTDSDSNCLTTGDGGPCTVTNEFSQFNASIGASAFLTGGVRGEMSLLHTVIGLPHLERKTATTRAQVSLMVPLHTLGAF